MKKVGIIAAILLFFQSAAYAHETTVFVSTPVSPPWKFEWVYYAFLFVLFGVNARLYWGMKARNIGLVLTLSGLHVFVFTLVFYMFGRFAATFSTAPPPGLGPPNWPLWGLEWEDVGGLFVRWNLYGVIFLVFCSYAASRIARMDTLKKKLAVIAVNVVVYTSFIAPFLATGALTHGHCGTYTFCNCRRNIARLAQGIVEYMRENNEKLPSGNNMAEMFEQIKPHIEYPCYFRTGNYVYYCPVGSTMEADYPPNIWNSGLSGWSLSDLRSLPYPEVLVICPYHGKIGYHLLTTSAVLELYNRGKDLYLPEWEEIITNEGAKYVISSEVRRSCGE